MMRTCLMSFMQPSKSVLMLSTCGRNRHDTQLLGMCWPTGVSTGLWVNQVHSLTFATNRTPCLTDGVPPGSTNAETLETLVSHHGAVGDGLVELRHGDLVGGQEDDGGDAPPRRRAVRRQR